MKNALYLILIMALVSCSSDDGGHEGTQNDLTGTWRLTKQVFEGYDLPIDDCTKQTKITIASTGSAEWTSFMDDDGICESTTSSFVFEAVNVNIDIQDNSDITNYYGKFISKDRIEITVFLKYDDLESKSVYTFSKD